MIVLKDFLTTTQVFKVGEAIADDLENLEAWVAGGFVGLEDEPTTELPAVSY